MTPGASSWPRWATARPSWRRSSNIDPTSPSSTCGCPPTQRDEGLRAAIEARRRVPGTPVLVLSQYVERQYATELLADRAGGVGYLLKDRVADIREFMDALRLVARGGTALDPEVVAQLMVQRR